MSKAFSALAEKVFPGSNAVSKNQAVGVSRELISSTPLHSAVYYNFYFSVIYFALNVFILRWKALNYIGWRIEGVTTVMFVMWCLAEPARLYAGYVGNLQERVPSLVAFVFLSVFPQGLCCIYLLVIQKPMMPMDKILNILMLIFLLVEVVLGYQATNHVIDNKTARFAVEYGQVEDMKRSELGGGMNNGEGKETQSEEEDSDAEFMDLMSQGKSGRKIARMKREQRKTQSRAKNSKSQREWREKERAYLRRKKERDALAALGQGDADSQYGDDFAATGAFGTDRHNRVTKREKSKNYEQV